jgi:hypothetical protein
VKRRVDVCCSYSETLKITMLKTVTRLVIMKAGEDLGVVICNVWKSMIVLQLFAVTTRKWTINQVTNPNPSIATHARDTIISKYA